MTSKIACCVAALLLSSATGTLADGTYGGKYATATTVSGLAMSGSFVTLATLTLPKGKKKRIVEVEAQTTETSAVLNALGLQARINGVNIEPFGYQVLTSCNHAYPGCSFVAHFWADVDALETASPGQFVNQPLNIEVMGVTDGSSSTVTLTARARMIKK